MQEQETTPYLTHLRIVDGPDLEKLITALQDSGELLHFTVAPHGAIDPADHTLFLWSTLLSLGITDQDGARRIELWNDHDDHWNVRFRGIYNPTTKTGTGSLERVRKPTEPMPPVPPLTGEQVNELLRQSA